MRLLAAFLMAVGMVLLSSSVPAPVSASGCGYDSCITVGEGQEMCTWVSTPCPKPPSSGTSGTSGGGNGGCDSDGPCPGDGGNNGPG